MYEHSLEIASILRKHSQGSSPRTKPRSLGKNGAGRQLSHEGHNEVRVEGLARTLVTATSVVFSRVSFTEPSSKGSCRLESGHAWGSGCPLTALWTPPGRGSSEGFRVLTSALAEAQWAPGWFGVMSVAESLGGAVFQWVFRLVERGRKCTFGPAL